MALPKQHLNPGAGPGMLVDFLQNIKRDSSTSCRLRLGLSLMLGSIISAGQLKKLNKLRSPSSTKLWQHNNLK